MFFLRILFLVFMCISLYMCAVVRQGSTLGDDQLIHRRPIGEPLSPVWDDQLNHDMIIQQLSKEPIIEVTRLGDFLKKKGKQAYFSHPIFIITLRSGIKGIFKTGNYSYAEVAAYRASNVLELRLVPPTVFRTINGNFGSLQLYIDAPDLAGASKLLKKLPQKQLSDMSIFYYVFGQWDTHRGNQLVSESKGRYFVALIDNSAMLHRSYSRYGEDIFVEKGENALVPSETCSTFPFDKAFTITKANYKKVRSLFCSYITEQHFKSLSQHPTLTYILWHDTLWLKREYDRKRSVPRYTTCYFRSTLDALRLLDRACLESIWAEWLVREPEHGAELIQLILDRRDEVLSNAVALGSCVLSIP